MAGVLCRQPGGADPPRPAAVEPVEKFSNPMPELNEASVTDRETKRVRFFFAFPQLNPKSEVEFLRWRSAVVPVAAWWGGQGVAKFSVA
jgi:hypothetical protein